MALARIFVEEVLKTSVPTQTVNEFSTTKRDLGLRKCCGGRSKPSYVSSILHLSIPPDLREAVVVSFYDGLGQDHYVEPAGWYYEG